MGDFDDLFKDLPSLKDIIEQKVAELKEELEKAIWSLRDEMNAKFEELKLREAEAKEAKFWEYLDHILNCEECKPVLVAFLEKHGYELKRKEEEAEQKEEVEPYVILPDGRKVKVKVE